MKQLVLFSVIFMVTQVPGLSGSIQCINDEGEYVDWYVIYKFPWKPFTSNSLYKGATYMYITSKTVEKGWTISQMTMEQNDNMLTKTFENMYSQGNEDMWLVYNDQISDGSFIDKFRSIGGHTKGVVGGNEKGGFWLIHSFPHFPTLNEYKYPNNAYWNGQSALCISLSAGELDKIGTAFKYNGPNFEKVQISPRLEKMYPNLKAVTDGEIINTPPWNITLKVASKSGTVFDVFAKSKSFDMDLYRWVAAELDTDVYAETWRIELFPLASYCSLPRKVINVKNIDSGTLGVTFSSLRDHSKWAISTSSKTPYVCIGDINRATRQLKRGGGTVCISNLQLWSAYNSLINEVKSCN